MPFSERELTHILDRLRSGEIVRASSAGGRYITEWRCENGEWVVDSFEEGTGFVARLSEDEMRSHIAVAAEEPFLRLFGQRA